MEAVLITMDPPPRAFINGAACFMPRMAARTRRAKVWSHASALVSSTVPTAARRAPALLKRMSRPPNSDMRRLPMAAAISRPLPGSRRSGRRRPYRGSAARGWRPSRPERRRRPRWRPRPRTTPQRPARCRTPPPVMTAILFSRRLACPRRLLPSDCFLDFEFRTRSPDRRSSPALASQAMIAWPRLSRSREAVRVTPSSPRPCPGPGARRGR